MSDPRREDVHVIGHEAVRRNTKLKIISALQQLRPCWFNDLVTNEPRFALEGT
jgi:hypothetical protein